MRRLVTNGLHPSHGNADGKWKVGSNKDKRSDSGVVESIPGTAYLCPHPNKSVFYLRHAKRRWPYLLRSRIDFRRRLQIAKGGAVLPESISGSCSPLERFYVARVNS